MSDDHARRTYQMTWGEIWVFGLIITAVLVLIGLLATIFLNSIIQGALVVGLVIGIVVVPLLLGLAFDKITRWYANG